MTMFHIILFCQGNQDSTVNRVNWLWTSWPNLILGRGRDFLFVSTSILALRPTQPLVQCLPEVKWLECEVDHSPATSAKVKNVWSFASTPTHAFMSWCISTGENLLLFSLSYIIFQTITNLKYFGFVGCIPLNILITSTMHFLIIFLT
jgi:hypothetical protein